MPQDETRDGAGRCPQSNAKSDLVRSLTYRERQHAGQADGSEEQRGGAEDGECHVKRPLHEPVQEGVLFSVQTFVVKIASGIGAWVAGIVLSVVDFPSNAQAGDILAHTTFGLGLLYAPTMMVLFGISTYALTPFKDTRADYDEHLQRLEDAAT